MNDPEPVVAGVEAIEPERLFDQSRRGRQSAPTRPARLDRARKHSGKYDTRPDDRYCRGVADPVAQYLARYACPEAAIAGRLDGRWEATVVIPAMGESVDFIGGLEALAARPSLVICVVNQTLEAGDGIREANRRLLDALRSLGPRRPVVDADHIATPRFDLLVIDRASPGRELPAGQGVGLARRIGMDVALALAAADRAGPWLHTTDADVELPADYLAAAAGDAVALTYRYWHRTGDLDAVAARALALYEIGLRYYVLGIGAAGLPCAFSAIGSTLAVDARAYAQVRGVPPRQAGEDFHLLAKLAKLGSIVRPRSAPIAIRGRREIRTPFGTAPAIARIAAGLEAGRDHQLYAPESFERLGRLRRALDRLAAGDRLELGDPILEAAFVEVGGPALVERAGAIVDPAIRRREIDQWLDALKALRLVHALRHAGLADRPWREALAAAPFIDLPEGGDLEAIRRALAEAEDAFLIDSSADRN